jgi:hypothetical protein
VHCVESLLRSRKSKQKGPVERKNSRENIEKRRGINEAICIQSKEACYEGAIQSKAKPMLPQENKKEAREREKGTGEGSAKLYAFTRRKPATMPQFSQKRRERQRIGERTERGRGINEAVCIQFKKDNNATTGHKLQGSSKDNLVVSMWK